MTPRRARPVVAVLCQLALAFAVHGGSDGACTMEHASTMRGHRGASHAAMGHAGPSNDVSARATTAAPAPDAGEHCGPAPCLPESCRSTSGCGETRVACNGKVDGIIEGRRIRVRHATVLPPQFLGRGPEPPPPRA